LWVLKSPHLASSGQPIEIGVSHERVILERRTNRTEQL